MIKNFSKLALAAAAAICLPAAAQAGTATATSTATFKVITQCSISGATLNLGTFTTNNTWGDVAASIGLISSGMAYTPGTSGESFLTNMGSITCDNATPYSFNIKGSSADVDSVGAIKYTVNGKVAKLLLYVNKVGLNTLADASPATMPGKGRPLGWTLQSSTGTGVAQTLVGSASLYTGGTSGTVALTDALTVAGSYSDTLTYTLNF